MEDLQLLREYAQERSQRAFAALVQRYVGLVYSSALRQVHDAHEAEDITQAVFLCLARSAHKLRPTVILSGWLLTAARFHSLKSLRSQRRREHHERKAAQMAQLQSHSDEGDARWEEIAPYLDEAIGELGQKSRDALLLRYLDGQSMAEVGQRLGISEDTAKRRVSRAVERLRASFAKRGVAVSAVAVGALLAANAVQAAPAHVAVAAAAVSSAQAATATTIWETVKGLLTRLLWQRAQTAAIIAISVLLVGTAAAVTVYQMRGASPARSGEQASPPPVQADAPAPAARRTQEQAARVAAAGRGAGFASSPFATPEYLRGGAMPVLETVRILPRAVFTTIHAEHADANRGVSIAAPGLSSLDEGDWVRFDKVNFDGGATDFVARVAVAPGAGNRSIDVRSGSPDGPILASLKLSSTGGTKAFRAQSAPVGAPVAGTHEIYLTFTGGRDIATLDWIKFVRLPRDGRGRIEAESLDDMRGARDQGTAVGNLDETDHLRYRQVKFDKAPAWFHVNISAGRNSGARAIEVRLDRTDGPVVARLNVAATGDWRSYIVQSAPVSGLEGMHDLFLTFIGTSVCNIDWFCLSESPTPPQGTR